jgi:hypothetical protein
MAGETRNKFFRVILLIFFISSLFTLINATPSNVSKIRLINVGNEEEEMADCDLGNDDLTGEGSVHVCDESNSKNWFIYCGGKLLEASAESKVF